MNQLDRLAEDDQHAVLDVLDDLYDLHLDGHDTETAERIYQEGLASQPRASKATATPAPPTATTRTSTPVR